MDVHQGWTRRPMCEESLRGESITCGQVILVVLTREFVHCVHPSPSLGVLQLKKRAVGSLQRSPKWMPAGPVTLSGCTRLIHQLWSWMSGVLLSLLLTLKSTVIYFRLWKHRLR